MSDIPIPLRLANRPTRGGLVVPWISVQLGETRLLVESGAVPTRLSLGARIDNPLKVRPVRPVRTITITTGEPA